jgi:two-component system, OmpR family, sensor kinase
MSLRARLLLSLTAILAGALVVAGVLLVGLTRTSLVARMDQELLSAASGGTRIQKLGDLAATDAAAGRRLAVLRLDRQGRVVRALPSGFASDPDPLPLLPAYTDGIPADAYGRIDQRESVDGSIEYRVLLAQVRPNLVVAVAAPMATIDEAQQALVRTMLVVGVLAMAAMLLLGWLVLRLGLLPLERIADTAEAISAGDLSHRAGVPHDGTEVGRLGAAFDTMLDQIQGAFDEQKSALEAAERSEGRLRRFVADASHELRTPLTTVRGYADLYRAGGLTEPDALATAMDRIGSESRRMGSLLDDLLLLARLDQGRPLRTDAVDLGRLVDEAVADMRVLEPDRVISVTLDRGVVVIGDQDRLRQVVGNLLANVRVHAGPGTPVEVGLTQDGGDAELRVVDHGPGIEPEDGARVFDRFYRADPGRSRERGGTGLGLPIAASIVAAHGGRMWHEATPGGGATFVVRLGPTGGSQPVPGGRTVDAPTL